MFKVVQMQSFAKNLYGAPPTKNKIYTVPYAADKIIGPIWSYFGMQRNGIFASRRSSDKLSFLNLRGDPPEIPAYVARIPYISAIFV